MLDLFRQAFAWSSVGKGEAFVFDASLDVKVRHLLPAPSRGGLHEESRLEHEERSSDVLYTLARKPVRHSHELYPSSLDLQLSFTMILMVLLREEGGDVVAETQYEAFNCLAVVEW